MDTHPTPTPGSSQPSLAAMMVTSPRSARAGQECPNRNRAEVTRSEGSASTQKVCCQLWPRAVLLGTQSNPTVDTLLCPSF